MNRLEIIQGLLDHPQTPIQLYVKLLRTINNEYKKRNLARREVFLASLSKPIVIHDYNQLLASLDL